MDLRAIEATWVITGDPALAPIASGAVVLDDQDCVVEVGEASAMRLRYPDARWEEQRAVLLPGLINAHTHLELSALRGRVSGGRGFGDWVMGLVEQRSERAPENDLDAIDAGVSELIAAGTAAVGEVTNSLAAVDALGTAPLLGRVFHEIFGMRRDTGEVMLAMAEQQHAERTSWPDNLSYTLAPHTPFTLNPEILRETIKRSRDLGERTTLHLCEHGAERAYLRDGSGPFAEFLAKRGSSAADWTFPGTDPVRYAASLNALAPDVLCVHLADARPDELALVARAGAPVVLCPRSNLHIELKLPPLLAILDAGLRPGLGTDSLASCASLDVMEEARSLAERFPTVAARTLIAMATSFGAEVLGFERTLGTLAPGKQPGVLAFACEGPVVDPERFVLSRRASHRDVLARPARTLAPSSEAA